MEEILVLTEAGQYVVAWFSQPYCPTGYEGWHVYDGYEWHVLQGAQPTQWKSLD